MKIEYDVVVEERSTADFIRVVEGYLTQGWDLVGGAQYVMTPKGGFWSQTVIRKREQS